MKMKIKIKINVKMKRKVKIKLKIKITKKRKKKFSQKNATIFLRNLTIIIKSILFDSILLCHTISHINIIENVSIIAITALSLSAKCNSHTSA